MRGRELGLIIGGKALGRTVKEVTEILPLPELYKKVIRGAIGVGSMFAAVSDKVRVPEDAKVVLAVEGADIVVDEVIDTIFEMLRKPKTASASAPTLSVPVIEVTPKEETTQKAEAKIF